MVERFGTLEEVCDGLASLFVAGFIGSSPMNFAEVEQVQDGAILQLTGHRIPTPPQFDLSAVGARLVLGIRPQDVALAEPGSPASVQGTVWMTELIGSERLIEVELAPKLRCTPQVRAEVRPGAEQSVGVALRPRQIASVRRHLGAGTAPPLRRAGGHWTPLG